MRSTRTWLATAAATAAVGTAAIGGALALSGGEVAAGAAGRAAVECGVSDVSLSYHADGAGMSHRFGRIVVTNTSDRSCWIQGYGGLSYVGGGNGTQVGAPATRDPSPTPRTVLKPGDRVAGLVRASTTAPYSPSVCRPTHVDGFRVYLPDETHSVYLPHATTGCRNPSVHLLGHQAFRPGTQR